MNFEELGDLCRPRPLRENSVSDNPKEKFGRYHSSIFWDVPQFGRKRWVVGMNLDVDFSKFDGMDLSVEEMASLCVEALNLPPPRKKYAKKDPKPKYGHLELHSAKLVERGPDKYISLTVITKERKNRLFWGKGRNVG